MAEAPSCQRAARSTPSSSWQQQPHPRAVDLKAVAEVERLCCREARKALPRQPHLHTTRVLGARKLEQRVEQRRADPLPAPRPPRGRGRGGAPHPPPTASRSQPAPPAPPPRRGGGRRPARPATPARRPPP